MVSPPQAHKTKVRVAAARLLLQEGRGRGEVIRTLRQQFGVSYQSALRTMRYVDDEQVKEINKERAVLVARQSSKLNHAQRRALARKRQLTDREGNPTAEVDDPDLATYIRAVAEQNKLLGLNAPDRKQLLVHNSTELIQDIVDLVWDFVPSLERRREFLKRLQLRVKQRMTEDPDLFTIEQPKEVAVEVVEEEGKQGSPKSLGDGYGQNGKNGTA